ncbi:MAG: DUF4390 domain-containing protein [Azoarcus sp.]|nr:DUF4390 domain-containing protein [Azoarcus sp.]
MLLIVFLALSSIPVRASDASITYASIVLSKEGHILNADFSFELNQRLIDALAHGVALHFVAELRIERPRWYWFDKLLIHRRLEYRLSYHAMTRNYRLNIGSLHRNFDTLSDAVRMMERIRNLYVAPPDAFDEKGRYEATLRFFHNTALLPKPFQLSALANGNWDFSTGWTKLSFTSEMTLPEKETPEEMAKKTETDEAAREEAPPE